MPNKTPKHTGIAREKLSEPRDVLPHASTLQQHNDRIVEANNRIRDMIGRLEL